MSCGVGHRHGSDPTLLWLWCRPAAVAPIRPLAREPPYATIAALKVQNTKKKKKKKEKRNHIDIVVCWEEKKMPLVLGFKQTR